MAKDDAVDWEGISVIFGTQNNLIAYMGTFGGAVTWWRFHKGRCGSNATQRPRAAPGWERTLARARALPKSWLPGRSLCVRQSAAEIAGKACGDRC